VALNIVIDGYVYDGTGSLCDGTVAYQAYFYKTNAGSSNSKWNNTRIVESGLSAGYYNINLGDGDWLTQDGSASSNDVVIVVFWDPETSDRMDACSLLNEWSCFRIILDGSSTYTTQAQVKPNICPNLSWSLAPTGLVGQSVTATNSSNDQHQWDFMGTTFYQRNSWYTTLTTVNAVNNSVYDWGDTNSDTVAGAGNGAHSWDASGTYDIELVIEDECGCTVTGTDQITISNNAPVPNIIMIPSDPDPNTPVSFQYSGTDVDDVITNIAWTINDSGVYGNTNTLSATQLRDDIVPHTSGVGTDWHGVSGASGAFTNPGNHQVSIVVSWWDGFTTQTINYSEVFNQGKFSGPTVDFIQDPVKADLGTPTTFTNTSTNTNRVGLGLPDHFEYTWRWVDDTLVETETDKPYTYELVKTPTTAACEVRLCAQWSDGWDTINTCTTKDVIFDTIVTITEEDCYYNLNIIGTSSDGSVSGYSWTIASGISETGPWIDTWESPIGMEQNDKKICFTSEGWYQITGYVYGTGTTTSDTETIYIDTVCPEGTGGEVIYVLWNGTGPLDVGGDWDHSGEGSEKSTCMYTGTYGLKAYGLKKNDEFEFASPDSAYVLTTPYTYLRMWVNTNRWERNKDMRLTFYGSHNNSYNPGGFHTSTLNLNDYMALDYHGNQGTTPDWQHVLIPLEDFDFDDLMHPEHAGLPFYVHKLKFEARGKINICVDDIDLYAGVPIPVAICDPYVTGEEYGHLTTAGAGIAPSVRANDISITPEISATTDLTPDMRADGAEITPKIIRNFPPPRVT